MRKFITDYFLRERGIAVLGVFFWLVSLVLLFASVKIGVAFSVRDGARGFLQKPNWYLYPVFFPAMMWLCYKTWSDYAQGWKSLVAEGVLHTEGFHLVSSQQFAPLARLFARVRPILLAVACLLGICLTTIDSRSAYHLLPSSAAVDAEIAAKCTDRDFTIAARIPEYFPSTTWTASIWFSTWTYLMQAGLIALGFLCLLQILFHGILFSFFEQLTKPFRIDILLRIDDMNEQFGLSSWNHAINQGYIFLAFCMGIALVSHFAQPFNRTGLEDCTSSAGQRMMGSLLWTIVAAPTILPVLARFARLNKVREIVRIANNESVTESFRKQRLWPWDDWSVGKLFLLLSVIEWALVANIINIPKLIDILLKRAG